MHNKRKVIATLTTIPSRMENVHITIESILNQTIKPDEVVLSIPTHSIREEKDYELSDEVKKLSDEGKITLLYCDEDYGPATKLLGVLKREIDLDYTEDREPILITFDDDKRYHNNAIHNLLSSDLIECGVVVCRKGSRIYMVDEDHPFHTDKNSGILERIYNGADESSVRRVDVLFGTGGVAYRPSYFDHDVFDYKAENEDFPEVSAFFVDDIFLSGYLAEKDVNIVVASFGKTAAQEKMAAHVLDANTPNAPVEALGTINKKTPELGKETIRYFDKAYNNQM
jgi:hypothetical protein